MRWRPLSVCLSDKGCCLKEGLSSFMKQMKKTMLELLKAQRIAFTSFGYVPDA